MIQINEEDDFNLKQINGGKQMLVQLPAEE